MLIIGFQLIRGLYTFTPIIVRYRAPRPPATAAMMNASTEGWRQQR